MDNIQNINLDELEKYVRDRREEEERAKLKAMQAERQRIYDEQQAAARAADEREAEERRKGDPNHKAAEMIHSALGERWDAFVALMVRLDTAKLGAALNYIANKQAAAEKHEEISAAPTIRGDRKRAAEAAFHTGIEAQLAAAGVRLDFTPE